MNLELAAIFLVIILIGINQLLLRFPRLLRRRSTVFSLMFSQVATGVAIIAFGLPGFEDSPMIAWFLGLVFFVHAARTYQVSLRESRSDSLNEFLTDEERLQQLRDQVQDEE